MKAVIRSGVCFNGVQLWLLEPNGAGGHRVIQPIQLTLSASILNNGDILPEPTIELSHENIRTLLPSLIEELVREGMMPDPSMEKGELKAMKEHLADLQMFIAQLLKLLNNSKS